MDSLIVVNIITSWFS